MYKAAINGDEEYFDRWLSTMKKNGLSMTMIKNKIEKLDHEQYSVLHYTIRYQRMSLSRKLIEEFHCDVNLLGRDGETPLHTAARFNQPSDAQNMIRFLVNHRADLSQRDNYGRTALHHATMRNNFHAAEQFIQLGTPIDVLDGNNATALHFACRFNAVDCVRLFIEHQASIDRQDTSGNTPLHCLARSREILFNHDEEREKIACILLHRAKDFLPRYLEMENKNQKTALSIACEYGHRNLVDILIRFRARIDHYTPIHMAVKSGNVDIVQLLIESRVKLTLVNSYAETPFHIACKYNRNDILRVLVRYQQDFEARDHQGYTPLLTAAYFDHHDCMKILLIHRVDITASDQHGRNILHICLEQNCRNAFRTCLEWIKHDVYKYHMFAQGDRYGNTALHAAAKNGAFEICELLIHTINRNIFRREYFSLMLKKNANQRTAIHEAAGMGNLNVFDLFVRFIDHEHRRAICEDSDDQLKTSLHLASADGHFEIVRYLLHQGANVSSGDMNDSTPLHQAAAHNRYSCVEILLDHQAPINQYDGKHNTPLHRASQHGHWKIVRLLLNSNADVGRINSDGYNSLEVAIINHHRSTVREFLQHRTWKKSLRNAQVQMIAERECEDLSTPLRKLIRYMPKEAEEVLTRCMIEIGNLEDDSYQIIFNYEFLEDQLSMIKWEQMRVNTRRDRSVYTLRENHPLYLIITYQQYDLLKHPLIDQLINRKWIQFSRTFFWILFLSYAFFLATFTSAILRVHHPQYYYSLFNASISTESCETISSNLLQHESFVLISKNSYDTTIKWILFITILLHMLKNLLLIFIRLRMFFGLSNLFELLALILSLIFSYDFHPDQISIRFRCSFQWQCGAIGILFGWITLVTYVQFLSPSGIYVVMLEVILQKFLRFIPILIIFILGFGLAFHMLLQNQDVYHHTFDAIIRTSLMLTGEFNYEDHLYHPENENNRSYYPIIYFLYVLFCVLITILIMNLLIAHAVGEIPPLIEHSNVKYSIIRMKLIMNYELLLSTFDGFIPYLKHRVKYLIERNQHEVIYPNRSSKCQGFLREKNQHRVMC